MKFFRSKRGWIVVVGILLVLFLFRPGAYRLRNRIASSLGAALGRKVTLDNVRLHLLPRPGFDLEGLVIEDDPAFSAEPMVRAQDVSAAIRIRSLLRGRLEIATLSATEPSINLVRNQEGRWNLATLLERSARIPVAPTGKSSSVRRPAFPYLEAAHARINFKIGQAKKSYALTDGDVALWQDSENSWGARLKAQPVRTDFHLTDTGLLELNALWLRAPNLRETPMQVTLHWDKGQLGQITKLLSGKDRGWRGGVSLTANLSGTPEALFIKSAVRIDQFHRYDILASDNVRLATACSGGFSIADGEFHNLLCESPVGSGMLRLAGTLRFAASESNYDLSLTAEKVPLASAARLLHQAKNQLPADLNATGLLDAQFHARREGSQSVEVDGNGTATEVRLSSNVGQSMFALGDIPLSLVTPSPPRNKSRRAGSKGQVLESIEPQLRIGTFPIALGTSAPAFAGGWISRIGYRFSLTGDSTAKDLFRLGSVLGLSGLGPSAEGIARVAIDVSGDWLGFAAPAVAGTAQLRNVRAEVLGLNTPIEISSATMTLAPESASLQSIAAQIGSTHWSGSVIAPRHCQTVSCPYRFNLAADHLSSDELVEWFSPRMRRPWYQILNPADAKSAPLLALEANGVLSIGSVELDRLLASRIATQLDLGHGKIRMTNLSAQVLQGTHQGNWTIDFSTLPLKYQGSGRLQSISLAQVGILMNDAWIAGTADAKFDGTASGASLADLLADAAGTIQFTMNNGSLIHLDFPGTAGPFSVRRFTGSLQFTRGNWELSAGRLESRDGVYQLSGTGSGRNGLKILWSRGDEQAWSLTGTLSKPRLERINRTQAEAKTATQP